MLVGGTGVKLSKVCNKTGLVQTVHRGLGEGGGMCSQVSGCEGLKESLTH